MDTKNGNQPQKTESRYSKVYAAQPRMAKPICRQHHESNGKGCCMSHTPGAWSIQEQPMTFQGRDGLVGALILGRDGGTVVAEIRGAVLIEGEVHAENMANARLLVAAPKMLDALQKIAVWLRGGDYDTRGGLIEMARLASVAEDVIAQATEDEGENEWSDA
jgi:hypothetical protein